MDLSNVCCTECGSVISTMDNFGGQCSLCKKVICRMCFESTVTLESYGMPDLYICEKCYKNLMPGRITNEPPQWAKFRRDHEN